MLDDLGGAGCGLVGCPCHYDTPPVPCSSGWLGDSVAGLQAQCTMESLCYACEEHMHTRICNAVLRFQECKSRRRVIDGTKKKAKDQKTSTGTLSSVYVTDVNGGFLICTLSTMESDLVRLMMAAVVPMAYQEHFKARVVQGTLQ